MISLALRRDLSREPYERLVGRVSGRWGSSATCQGRWRASGRRPGGRKEDPVAAARSNRYAPPHTRTPDTLAVAAAHAPCHRRVHAGRGRLGSSWVGPFIQPAVQGRADDLGRRSRRPLSRRSVAVGGLSIGGTASRPPFPHVTLAVSNRQLSSHAHPIWMRTMREWLHPLSGDLYERRAAEVSAPGPEPLQPVVTPGRTDPLQPVAGRPRS